MEIAADGSRIVHAFRVPNLDRSAVYHSCWLAEFMSRSSIGGHSSITSVANLHNSGYACRRHSDLAPHLKYNCGTNSEWRLYNAAYGRTRVPLRTV